MTNYQSVFYKKELEMDSIHETTGFECGFNFKIFYWNLKNIRDRNDYKFDNFDTLRLYSYN